MEKLEWFALEYEEKERSTDWYWALGVIVITSSIASIIYNNYFFAALLLISGILLGFFAIKKPDIISYELNTDGLKIRNQLYPYKNIKSFYVQSGEKPILFIKSERVFMPVIEIPIENNLTSSIHSIMISKNVVEEEMKEHPSLKIMNSLGF
ncbi:hypothetical protein A2575_00080 [Candidatus Roizmanbacteria bacterium RIFOXYD1_FULL_41_24]|uniref:DUF5673 domain-containing protein n=2 Tax=Candidatus Nomuraibacteriota TaxID=1752729 RepID=A0A1F6YVG8_9BACT|nr:MAG: hypothetical protein UR91_C0049G0002 [Candidatus Nomurabacteria bacterium GW2011_GWC2_35_8]OGJ04853.1 MAG: hypothetical protein A2238_03060 [Candidatus Nomurabacteria bacterium RIFOXYA2_FULL_35_9]OGJ10356.1 MAG: hypothetical protein A2456_01885 [Candidatus Nomurabacteria bacterium RIFOXYC2_FULL_36_19]OGJ14617.1 MAG: hypothetical protein A2554_02480 [Candidatus Nomurabacteria bacterium RIFOXYD2_FULL_35_12]OGK75188.1 MAG: hypothetical protein A2575_00080 [Candidatus Roizmanbacteria bacter